MTEITHPWSVLVPVIQIPETGLQRDIVANASQRAGVASLGGIVDVLSLKASLVLSPIGDRNIHVVGRVQGRVVQTCVVTLDPVEADLDEPVDQVFAPPSQIRELAALVDEAAESDVETPDPPEPIENGFIDIGHLVTDALFLGLDPYPRKPDASFEPVIQPPDPEDHPFAALKALQTESKG